MIKVPQEVGTLCSKLSYAFPSIWQRETLNEVKQIEEDGRKKFFFSLPLLYLLLFALA